MTISLLPVLGLKKLSWLQFSYWALVLIGIFVLYFGELGKSRKHSPVPKYFDPLSSKPIFRIIVFLYFQFLLTRFYPTSYAFYNSIFPFVVFSSLIASLLMLIPTQSKAKEIGPPIPFIRWDRYFIIGGLILLLVQFFQYHQGELPHTDGILLVGMSLALYIITVINIDLFVPGHFHFDKIPTYALLVFSSCALVWGACDIVSLHIGKYKAQKEAQSGHLVSSINIYLDLEKRNWPSVTLAESGQYLELARDLVSNKEGIDEALILLRTLSGHDHSCLSDPTFFEVFVKVGDCKAEQGLYSEARKIYDEISHLTANPVGVLAHIRKNAQEPYVKEMWGDKPYITISATGGDRQKLLMHWINNEGLVHKKMEIKLSNDSVEQGRNSYRLTVEYDHTVSKPYPELGEFDYWVFDTGIKMPPFPIGFRVFCKSGSNKQNSIRLVYNFQSSVLSGTRGGDRVIVTENDWQEVAINDVVFPANYGQVEVNKIGIDTFAHDGEFLLDEFQIFSSFLVTDPAGSPAKTAGSNEGNLQ